MKKITEKTFYKYLKCPLWLYFELHHEADKTHEPLMRQLQDGGLLKKKEMELLADRDDIAEVTEEDPDAAFRQTLEFMRDGRQAIYSPTLIDKRFVGNPDILEKVEGQSKFGDYYYVAADIKRTHKVYDDHKFQGCFYAELLDKIQNVKPYKGYVMNTNGEVMEYLIEEFESEYKLTLDEIEKVIAGRRPNHFLTSGCKQSPWFDECYTFSQSCDDLSLLNRVWRTEVKRLKAAGIETIQRLAEMHLDDLKEKVDDVDEERLEFMKKQAQSIEGGQHEVLETVDLPEPDGPELHFDIESDPLRDFDYLFGVLVVEDGKRAYHSFLAEKPGDEEKMWNEFLDFIEQYPDAPIYHYGYFEENVINRFASRYGISQGLMKQLDLNMFDLIDEMRGSIIFPFPFYSLKDIATYTGFQWRADDASGANSVMWFEDWLEEGDDEVLQKLLNYNEDDVRATDALVQWLRDHAVK
jgi:uncharacterized protein